MAGEPKCRLTKYDCHILGFGATQLSFGFSKIWYSDYVLSGELLDAPLPNDPARTYRDKYAPSLDLHDFGRSSLTNICGVGVFLITRDNRILVSKHSRSVQVYADTFSYSASGTMDWKPDVHPFDEVARECREEIGHRVNLEDMRLIGFGLDTKKLYFQFSFSEHAGLSSDEILSAARHARDFHAEMEDLVAVPFELSEIVPLIKSRRWEPAAAASMLTLCVKRFGLDKVEAAIDPHFVKKRARNEMVAEWERRASRPGDLAVMSARYPAYRSSEESTKYVDAVLEFLDRDIAHQDVLEIGAGTGRITEKLVRSARKVTCLDISQNMIELNRKRLDEWASQVTYLRIFAQDYESWHHDVVISSQVMIHNVGDHEFRDLVRVMCSCSNTIFLFEHIDVGYQVSEHTRPRSRAELLAAFAGYRVEREREYRLFGDTILFLKLVR